MRKAFVILLLLAGAGLVLTGWLVRDWQRFAGQPLVAEGPLVLWVAPGTSFRGLVRQLEILGVTRADWRWRVMGRLRGASLHAGEYRLPAGIGPERLLATIEQGRVYQHRMTIVEGWTTARLRRELAGDPRLHQVAAGLAPAELMARLDCAGCPAEGQFLPETYHFVRGASDLELLQRAHAAMTEALERIWAARRADLPLAGPAELLVLASLIERETGNGSERRRIAGVFVRRLQRGMRLQTDPAVIYGLGEDFDGRLRRVHLRTDHPWNTYTRHGLPPTPIALPGRAALKAAADPADGSALYFVSRGDGSHHFSDTLAEHNAAVDRYIRGID